MKVYRGRVWAHESSNSWWSMKTYLLTSMPTIDPHQNFSASWQSILTWLSTAHRRTISLFMPNTMEKLLYRSLIRSQQETVVNSNKLVGLVIRTVREGQPTIVLMIKKMIKKRQNTLKDKGKRKSRYNGVGITIKDKIKLLRSRKRTKRSCGHQHHQTQTKILQTSALMSNHKEDSSRRNSRTIASSLVDSIWNDQQPKVGISYDRYGRWY